MIELVGIAKEVGTVRNNVKRIYSEVERIDFGATQIRDLPQEAAQTKMPLLTEDHVVIKKMEVVPVICRRRPISLDPRITYEFPFCKYRVFLNQGTWSDQEYLVQKQCEPIQRGGFLIVLHQGRGTLIARDVLQASFPKIKRVSNINMVITTSHGEKSRKFSIGSVFLIVVDDVWYSETCDLLKLSLSEFKAS